MKNNNLTFWKKVKLYFHICPCGYIIEAWTWGVYKCRGCGKTYYV